MSGLLAICLLPFMMFLGLKFLCYLLKPAPKPVYRVDHYTVVRRVK